MIDLHNLSKRRKLSQSCEECIGLSSSSLSQDIKSVVIRKSGKSGTPSIQVSVNEISKANMINNKVSPSKFTVIRKVNNIDVYTLGNRYEDNVHTCYPCSI